MRFFYRHLSAVALSSSRANDRRAGRPLRGPAVLSGKRTGARNVNQTRKEIPAFERLIRPKRTTAGNILDKGPAVLRIWQPGRTEKSRAANMKDSDQNPFCHDEFTASLARHRASLANAVAIAALLASIIVIAAIGAPFEIIVNALK